MLARRAARHKRSLEEELRRILDASAKADAENPDALEPLGSFIVRITRPGHSDVVNFIDAQRKVPDRPPVTFE